MYIADASEIAAAKMKGLDEASHAQPAAKKPQKDVNTFINNQLKFVGGNNAIPPEQMKCNILKAKAEEQYRKGMCIVLTDCKLTLIDLNNSVLVDIRADN